MSSGQDFSDSWLYGIEIDDGVSVWEPEDTDIDELYCDYGEPVG